MPIELTEQQQRAIDDLAGAPARFVDPRTGALYVLVPASDYQAFREVPDGEREQWANRLIALRGAPGRADASVRRSDDAAVLEMVRAAFARCERPEHFTNYTHCEECAEHDDLLLSRDPDTLRIEDVGNPGWDPLCYVDANGFG